MSAGTPRVAVVTIAHGRHEHLEAQHRSLALAHRRPDVYVVVAMDDDALASANLEGLRRDVVHLAADPRGLPLAAARNRGVEAALAAGAEVVVLLDVDCLAGPDLVDAYVAAVSDAPDTVWSGPVTYLGPSGPEGYPLGSLEDLDDPHPARPAPPPGSREQGGDPDLFWSLSFALGATAWRHVGGFSEDYVGYGGEDTDFGRAVVAAGLALAWDGSARAYHQHHAVEKPPTRHLDDILRNGRIFADRWGSWPMLGWLEQMEVLGLVEQTDQGWARPRRPELQAVRVVVPAHDEEQHVDACLTSIAVAAAEVAGLDVRAVVVLDRCTDRTAEIARTHDVDLVTTDAGSVGAARAAGVQRVVDEGLDPTRVLVVNTDADCRVPPTWLVEHVALGSVHDLVQGEVSPEPDDLSPAVLAAWREQNPAGRGSLHGANLSVRLDRYLAVGGFPALDEHEDLLLVRALKAAGASAVCGGATVTTSGRLHGRVQGGFAGYLRDLAATGEVSAKDPA